MSTRLPPHNMDAEEGVIGSLVIGGNITEVVGLSGDDFYSERYRWMFEACKRLAERGVSIDPITLGNELGDKLAACGGAANLSYLVSICPTSLDLKYYGEIVSRLAFYRRMISVSEKIANIGYEANADIHLSANKADDLLLELRKKTAPSSIITPKQKGDILYERYMELNNQEGDAAISTGLIDLNRILGGGFYPGDLIIVGARTGMGKTTFLQNLANYIALLNNVLIFSCEMSIESLGDRDVASELGVPVNTIRWGKYSEEFLDKIMGVVNGIRKTNVYTYDETPITTAKILQASLNMKLRYGLGAIIVDYLGLLDDDIGENRNLTLGYMTKKLKQVARNLKIPVIVAHQLSRELEKREDKRPVLADLRESGHVEEDADDVIFLYRDSYYYDETTWQHTFGNNKPFPKNITELIIAKQRQGESNRTIRIYYDDTYQKFRDLIPEAQYG